jgi:hypothetical protein
VQWRRAVVHGAQEAEQQQRCGVRPSAWREREVAEQVVADQLPCAAIASGSAARRSAQCKPVMAW